MRKVLWIAGTQPKDMTPEVYLENAKLLATACKGELVAFGEGSYIIIGDSEADKLFKDIQRMADKVNT